VPILLLTLLLISSCSTKNGKENLVQVTVRFDPRECGDITINQMDVGKTFEVLSEESDRDGSVSDEVLDFETDLVEVKKILSVPVENNYASFEFEPDPEERKRYLICPPINSSHFTPYHCFQPIGEGKDVLINIRLFGKDCDHY